jgi:hypothetical protein
MCLHAGAAEDATTDLPCPPSSMVVAADLLPR